MKNSFLIVLCIFWVNVIQSQNIADLKKFFDYDKAQDLDFRILSTDDSVQATLYQVVFTGTQGLKVTGTLFIPKGELRQYPAVIILPDDGQEKTEYYGESLQLAKESIASFVLDMISERAEPYRLYFNNFDSPRKDYSVYRQTVLDIRRSIDCLEQVPKVDRERIGFIGFGKGAIAGAIVSGVESRKISYILLECPPVIANDLLHSDDPEIVKAHNSLTSEQISQYESQLKILDPVKYLGNRLYSGVLFQFSENDPFISTELAQQTFKAANNPKSIKFYNVSRYELIDNSGAINDRITWLKKNL